MNDLYLTKAEILIVEDESIVALDIKQRLENMGYSVVGTAATGEQGIQKADVLRPDLVLMDIKLKGTMDGIEAAEIIRNRFHLPIIFLTAFADEPTLKRARITEAFGYILKPFEERELSIQIEMALYKHQAENKLRESESRLRTIFTSVTDGLFLLNTDGRFMDVNPAGCTMFGYSWAEFLQFDITFLTDPEDTARLLSDLQRPKESMNSLKEYRMNHKNGSVLWVEMALTPMQENGVYQTVAVMRDVTFRKRAELALRESEERYSLAIQGANDGLWDWNLKTGAVFYSPRWKEILGFGNDEIQGRSEEWFGLIHPEDLERFKLNFSNHLSDLTSHFEIEYRILSKKDGYRWVLTRGKAVSDADGIPYRMSGSLSDVTERKRAEDQLLHDAFHDTLTGLHNRALFLDRLQFTIERSKRYKDTDFAVLFLDLDRFKVINDSLGHQVGDQLLIAFSERLKQFLRSSDTLARLGGDEFVILLEELNNPIEAVLVSERIQEDLKKPFELAGQSVFVSASIGIVSGAIGYESPEDILRDADIAMYRAKSAGKACHALFDSDLRQRAINRLELEGDLRMALSRNELKVFYQPILSLTTGKITGFEALLRWFHPIRGLILPSDFIPIAEETGLILPIGRWVLKEACNQLHIWQTQFVNDPILTMSINISSKQFAHPLFFEQIQQVLEETKLDPHTLKLEITESLMMENSKTLISIITELRKMGIQVLIDDFGTGYSSLGYIQHFPIDIIKIDRSFIHEMDSKDGHSKIARSIVQLAQELKLDTIAEGIESEHQLRQLKDLECLYGQGFLFSKALQKEEVEDLLEKDYLFIESKNQDLQSTLCDQKSCCG